jgi:hypothetical protein
VSDIIVRFWWPEYELWMKEDLPEFMGLIDSGERLATCRIEDDDHGSFDVFGNIYIVQFEGLMGEKINTTHPILSRASAVYESPGRVSYVFITSKPAFDFQSWATVAFGLAHRSKDAGLTDINGIGPKRIYDKASLGVCLTYTLENDIDDIAASLRTEHEATMSRILSEGRQIERQVVADHLRALPYGDYLKTDHWQEMRAEALKRAGNRCQVCNFPDKLHVHHRTYARRGHELLDDLTVLCERCHKLFHDNGRLARGE